MTIILSTLNARYTHASLGLRYLQANMGELQDQTEIMEFVIGGKTTEFAERLLAKNPTIIGFGVIGSITPLFFVSRLIMRFGPRTLIRFGNYFGALFLVLLGLTSDPLLWFFINIGFNFFMSILGVSVNSHSVLLQKQISKNVIARFHPKIAPDDAVITAAIESAL